MCEFVLFIFRNMNPSLSSLLDALIVLTEDADEKVSKASKRALETFKNGWRQNRGKLLLEDVKDCLCSLLTRLPRILHGSGSLLLSFVEIIQF